MVVRASGNFSRTSSFLGATRVDCYRRLETWNSHGDSKLEIHTVHISSYSSTNLSHFDINSHKRHETWNSRRERVLKVKTWNLQDCREKPCSRVFVRSMPHYRRCDHFSGGEKMQPGRELGHRCENSGRQRHNLG